MRISMDLLVQCSVANTLYIITYYICGKQLDWKVILYGTYCVETLMTKGGVAI